MQFQAKREIDEAADNPEFQPITYAAEQVGDVAEEVATPWGTAIAMPGDYKFSGSDSMNNPVVFVVAQAEVENPDIWVEL
jgi:hypothetical protein